MLRRPRTWRPVLALAAPLALAALAALADDGAPMTGAVRGRVTLAVEGARLSDLGPVVVYLDALEGRLAARPRAAVPQIHQKNARFVPPFLAIAAGETVEMVNDDAITHNVFSYSKPNDFDLGLYPRGESRSVVFREPGVVRVYCSIHQTMNLLIFVAPTPAFAVADAGGAFEIRDALPGKYRLKVWSALLPEAEETVEVAAGAAATKDVVVRERAK